MSGVWRAEPRRRTRGRNRGGRREPRARRELAPVCNRNPAGLAGATSLVVCGFVANDRSRQAFTRRMAGEICEDAHPMNPTSEQPQNESSAPLLSPHPALPEFYSAMAQRQDFVNGLFNNAAPDYDWVSKVMSFGSDRFYR